VVDPVGRRQAAAGARRQSYCCNLGTRAHCNLGTRARTASELVVFTRLVLRRQSYNDKYKGLVTVDFSLSVLSGPMSENSWPCLSSLLASHCMSSCVALLSPEVRWSEMERLVSLVLGLSAVSTLRNEWVLLHLYCLCRNECDCFHIRRAAV